jgi:leucine dehydrogenase
MSLLKHEELLVHRGDRSGLSMAIAIHSTALGPALGGARLWRYRALGDTIADALRLSEAMTYKAAAAGLELGGGKAVLCAPPDRELTPEGRRDLMLDLGDAVESLDGRYVTAEDVGTGTADMAIIGERTAHVMGRPADAGGSGDPSPVTARGVEVAIRACCEHRYGSPDLAGKVVTILGLGHVGLALAERLAKAGCVLRVSDIDQGRREAAARLGATWVDPDAVAGTECDVFAPCGLGGTIDSDSIDQLRCEIVCGSANNLLADDAYAAELTKRGIHYAPDFIANAGGLINVYGELRGLGRERLDELVDGIGDALGRVFEVASARSVTPLDAAKAVAEEALDAASGGRFGADLGGFAVGRVQAAEDDHQPEHRNGGDHRQRGAIAVDDLAR